MKKQDVPAELRGHFLHLYALAMTDGDFSPEEWKMLYFFASERGVSEEALNNILLSTTGHLSIPETVRTRIEYLYDFAVMIWADGVVTEDERITLRKYCRKFEFEEEVIDDLSEYLLHAVETGRTKAEVLAEIDQNENT